MGKEQDAIKQHYVPRAFLTRWCGDGEQFYPIKIVSSVPPNLEILEKTGVYPFCCEKYFYANIQGRKDDFSQKVEKSFTEIENEIYNILSRFENKILKNEQITFDDKYELSAVMLFLHMRGKKYLEWSKDFSNEMTKKMYGMVLQHKKEDEFKKLGFTKEEALEMNETMTINFGTAHHLQQLKDIQKLSFLVAKKYWRINISKNGEFMVTDTPYLDLPVKREGFYGNSIFEREQIFMLSPRIHISILNPRSITSKNIHRKDITANTFLVDNLNLLSLMNSIMFGFHSDEKILTRVKDLAYKVYKHKLYEKIKKVD